jgi:hypothetical protein
MTVVNRMGLVDVQDKGAPDISEVDRRGYPEGSANGRHANSDRQKGRAHGKAGMESEEGTAL